MTSCEPHVVNTNWLMSRRVTSGWGVCFEILTLQEEAKVGWFVMRALAHLNVSGAYSTRGWHTNGSCPMHFFGVDMNPFSVFKA